MRCLHVHHGGRIGATRPACSALGWDTDCVPELSAGHLYAFSGSVFFFPFFLQFSAGNWFVLLELALLSPCIVWMFE